MNSPKDRWVKSLEFNESSPGPILQDLQTVLDFVGSEGLRTSGKYDLLTASCLKDLDERLTFPARPNKQRPQQKSFPGIQGLYLLLRTTGLGILQGEAGKTRLCVDPAVLEQWRQLNPTEQYFNLLEAWLLHGAYEIWGERGVGWRSSFLIDVAQLVTDYLSRRRRRKTADLPRLPTYKCAHLALLEMFGLAELERENEAGPVAWRIEDAELTPLGHAIVDVIHEIILSDDVLMEERREYSFGALQTHLGSYFPAWKNNLVVPEAGFRDGVYHIKVSLGKVWRRIAIPATCDLEQLAYAILAAYEFDDDHLFCFTLRDRHGKKLDVEHPQCDAQHFADQMKLGAAPIRVGETVRFLYDFGDAWTFSVKLEDVEESNTKLKKPTLIESRGQSPSQYDWGDQ